MGVSVLRVIVNLGWSAACELRSTRLYCLLVLRAPPLQIIPRISIDGSGVRTRGHAEDTALLKDRWIIADVDFCMTGIWLCDSLVC